MVKVEQDLEFLLEYPLETLAAAVDLHCGHSGIRKVSQKDGAKPSGSNNPRLREIQSQPLYLLPTESLHGAILDEGGAGFRPAHAFLDDQPITPAFELESEELKETHDEEQEEEGSRQAENHGDSMVKVSSFSSGF